MSGEEREVFKPDGGGAHATVDEEEGWLSSRSRRKGGAGRGGRGRGRGVVEDLEVA